jgi:hypothetical protein
VVAAGRVVAVEVAGRVVTAVVPGAGDEPPLAPA